MQFFATQLCLIFLLHFCACAKEKRSPLEIGYASFTHIPIKYKHDVFAPEKVSKNSLRPRDVWVPGHISHHAYIPAHHHVIIPAHTVLISRTVHTLLGDDNKYVLYEDDPYRRTYGGFGVGGGSGGRGAGHGYQVSF